jgi:hypothetical protein
MWCQPCVAALEIPGKLFLPLMKGKRKERVGRSLMKMQSNHPLPPSFIRRGNDKITNYPVIPPS